MKKQHETTPPHDIKTDLKHDTMEFSAATEGDDKLDTDDGTYEEEEITAEELYILEEDDVESLAYALNSAETDKQADSDNLPEEDWQEDLPDGAADKDNDEEYRR